MELLSIGLPNRRKLPSRREVLCALQTVLLLALIGTIARAQQRRVDEPGDQEDLNRELWEFARKTPYQQILSYVNAAQRESKASQTTEVELPDGWRILPAGAQVEVGRLPYEAILFAGKLVVLNTGYYYPKDEESQEVSIVDVTSRQVVKTLRIRSLFPSAVVGADGDLYISGGYDQKVYRISKQFEVVREYPVNGFAGGLAFIDRTRLAVGYMATKIANGNYVSGKLAILDTSSGAIEREVNVGYFPYAVRFVNSKLYVTLLGEHRLLVFDSGLKLKKSIEVGRTPMEMCGDANRLYVVNTGSDSLSALDPRSDRMMFAMPLPKFESSFGAAPTSCIVESQRLYVTLGEMNAVAVFDWKGSLEAVIPTGWYPTKVLLDKDHLFVLNAKGIRGRRPNPKGPQPVGGNRIGDYVLTLLKGSLSIVNRKDIGRNASRWRKQVESSNPLFVSANAPKLIKHVFYVVKENRTYDQVLGDLGRGNGDPNLTLFGEEISPVQHQLAREFVTLDNFFVNGEVSVLGHAYTTAGYAGPFSQWMASVEYSTRWKSGGYSTSPAVEAPAYIWDRLNDKGADYRFYGEDYFLFNRSYRIIADTYGAESALAKAFYQKSLIGEDKRERGQQFFDLATAFYDKAGSREAIFELLGQNEFAQPFSRILVGDDSLAAALSKDRPFRQKFADSLYHYAFNFPTWDMATSDLERTRAWKADFEKQVKSGTVPQLEYVWLPNDHTNGNSKKLLDPFQFVAQNDAALGSLIETISRSPVWKDSLILVVEDDAQNGPDHVDATRTIAFAAGPYVKRGAVVSDRYDQLSMLRTIEILLGLEPINLGDRMAAPMFGIFTDHPDFRPFTPFKISDRISPADRQLYQRLAGLER